MNFNPKVVFEAGLDVYSRSPIRLMADRNFLKVKTADRNRYGVQTRSHQMVKPYVTIGRLHDYSDKFGPSYNNISVFTIFSRGYSLIFRLQIVTLHITVGSAITNKAEKSWRNLQFRMNFNRDVLMEKSLKISSYETSEKIREFFLEWINVFQATTDNPIDISSTMLKAVKWFDTWHNEQIVKDIIE